MGQFIGHQRAAQNLQPPTIGDDLERAVVDDADEFRADQDAQACFKAAQPAQCPKCLIGESPFAQRDAVILHELAQEARVPLFLGDEQIEDFDKGVVLVRLAVAIHRTAQLRPIGALAELEGRDGCRDQAPFAPRQRVIKRRGNLSRVGRLSAEVREPDRKILKHGVTCGFFG